MGRQKDRFTRLTDSLLEASIVGSYTRVGSAFRQAVGMLPPLTGCRLDGRVICVTGATSGIGKALTEQLLGLGATVVALGRSSERLEALASSLGPLANRLACVVCDVSDLDAVRACASDLVIRYPTLDGLVHNAGALDDSRVLTPQGLEQTVATHVVGPFLLTELLRPSLSRKQTSDRASRVIWVSSGGMYTEPLDVRALGSLEGPFDGVRAYARAKRAQVTLSELLAERLSPDHIVVHAMHPGWVNTPGVERSLPTFRAILGPSLRTPKEGADTIVWLLADDTLPLEASGRFWFDRQERPTHKLSRTRRADTRAERQKLWDWVASASQRTSQGDAGTA